MKKVKFGEFEISALTLGTVQFGLDYGIANEQGKPTYENCRDILSCAVQGGVTCLDTAAAYGNSEEILGKAIHELGVADEVTIVSKVPPHPQKNPTAAVMDEHCAATIEKSLKNLKIDCLPICLFHSESDSQYLPSLAKCIDRGLVKHVGVSTSNPQPTLDVINSQIASAVQIPLNFMDKRFTRQGVLRAAEQKNVAVFTRSVYLQGLAVMDLQKIETRRGIVPDLDEVISIRREVDKVAAANNISIVELAMRYVLGMQGVTSVLCGVDNVAQMQENIDLFSKGALDSDLMSEIYDLSGDLGDDVLNPVNWNKG